MSQYTGRTPTYQQRVVTSERKLNHRPSRCLFVPMLRTDYAYCLRDFGHGHVMYQRSDCINASTHMCSHVRVLHRYATFRSLPDWLVGWLRLGLVAYHSLTFMVAHVNQHHHRMSTSHCHASCANETEIKTRPVVVTHLACLLSVLQPRICRG